MAFTTVSIPKELADKAKKRIKGTGFHSLSSYVTYLLRQVITSAEVKKGKTAAFTREEEAELKKRLKAMGYI